jgi:hypothetical protein
MIRGTSFKGKGRGEKKKDLGMCCKIKFYIRLASVLAQNQEMVERRTALKQEYKTKEQHLKTELESLKQQLHAQRMRDALIQTDAAPSLRTDSRASARSESHNVSMRTHDTVHSQYDAHYESYHSDFDNTDSASVHTEESFASKEEGRGDIEEEWSHNKLDDAKRNEDNEVNEDIASSPLSKYSSPSVIHTSPEAAPYSLPPSPVRSSPDHSPPSRASPRLSIHSEAPSIRSSPASLHSPPPKSPASPSKHSPRSSPNSAVHSEVPSIYSSPSHSPLPTSPRSPLRVQPSTSSPSISLSHRRDSLSSLTSASSERRVEDEEMNTVLSKLEEEIVGLEKLKTDLTSKKGSHYRSK